MIEYPSSGYLTAGKARTTAIYLFVLNTKLMKGLHIKKPIDIVAHWALCINGYVYELAHTNPYNKHKPYNYSCTHESTFVQRGCAGFDRTAGESGKLVTSVSGRFSSLDASGQECNGPHWDMKKYHHPVSIARVDRQPSKQVAEVVFRRPCSIS